MKYAEPTEYVSENGHPAVTPLEKAIEEKNPEGWIKNEVTSFLPHCLYLCKEFG